MAWPTVPSPTIVFEGPTTIVVQAPSALDEPYADYYEIGINGLSSPVTVNPGDQVQFNGASLDTAYDDSTIQGFHYGEEEPLPSDVTYFDVHTVSGLEPPVIGTETNDVIPITMPELPGWAAPGSLRLYGSGPYGWNTSAITMSEMNIWVTNELLPGQSYEFWAQATELYSSNYVESEHAEAETTNISDQDQHMFATFQFPRTDNNWRFGAIPVPITCAFHDQRGCSTIASQGETALPGPGKPACASCGPTTTANQAA